MYLRKSSFCICWRYPRWWEHWPHHHYSRISSWIWCFGPRKIERSALCLFRECWSFLFILKETQCRCLQSPRPQNVEDCHSDPTRTSASYSSQTIHRARFVMRIIFSGWNCVAKIGYFRFSTTLMNLPYAWEIAGSFGPRSLLDNVFFLRWIWILYFRFSRFNEYCPELARFSEWIGPRNVADVRK